MEGLFRIYAVSGPLQFFRSMTRIPYCACANASGQNLATKSCRLHAANPKARALKVKPQRILTPKQYARRLRTPNASEHGQDNDELSARRQQELLEDPDAKKEV